jgi:phosphohistidine phosphatase
MMLYVLRHGVAEAAAPGGDDRARRLTPRGRDKMRVAAVGLRVLGLDLDAILTSPLPRAAETAALVAAAVGGRPQPEVLEALAGEAAPAEVLRALRPFARHDAIMIVGHEPGLGDLCSLLLTGSPRGASIQLKKGGCVAIEVGQLVPPAASRLVWMLTPRQLRRLGR